MADRTITLKITADSKEAEASIRRLAKAAQDVSGKGSGGSNNSYRSASFASAERDIKRMQAEQLRAEKQLTSQIEREARQQAAARVREMKRASSSLIAELKRIEAEEAKIGQNKSNTRSTFLGSFAGNVAATAVSSLTSLLTQGGAAILEYSAKLEATKIGFTTLIGSADLAQKHLNDLQQFAKTTPFEFAGLTDASRRLQSVGVSAERVIPIMTAVGNAVAAAGGTSESLDRVTLALSQIIAKGKVSAEELNQLNDAGVSGLRILSEQTGKTQAEILKLAEGGKISADLFVTAFEQFSKNKFGDAMTKQASTFNGALSNIKDSLLIAASQYFEPLFKTISEISAGTAKELEGADLGQAVRILAKNIAVGLGEALSAELKTEFANFKWSEVFTPDNLGASIAQGMFGNNGLIGSLFFDEIQSGVTNPANQQKFKADLTKLVDLGGVKYQFDPLTNSLKQVRDTVNETKNLGKQLDAEKAADDAKKLAKELTDIAKSYATQIAFFGDETTVGAAKQQLLAKGVSDFGTGAAKAIVGMAGMIDKLKETKKAADEYNDKLKASREEILKIREDAEFKIKFAEPTELDNFNRLVKKSAANFRELAPEIAATRYQLALLQQTQNVSKRGEAQKGIFEDIQSQIRQLEDVETTGITTKLKEIADVLNLKGFKALDGNGTDATRDVFAERVQSYIDNIKVLEGAGVSVEKVKASFAAFLASFKTDETNSSGQALQVFTDDKIPALIQLFLQLSGAVDKSNDALGRTQYKELVKDLDAQLDAANRGGRALTAYEQTVRALSDSTKKLTEAEKENLLNKASQVDAVNAAREVAEEYKRQFEDTTNFIEDKIHAFASGGFKGLFKSILDDLKNFLIRAAAQFLASKFFGFLSGKGFGGAQSSGGGGLFSGLGGIFGAGGNGSSQSGGGGGLFGGSQGGGIFSFLGGNRGGAANSGLNPIDLIGSNGNTIPGASGGGLGGLLGAGGISGALATGGASIAIALFIKSLKAKTPGSGAATGGLLGFLFGSLNQNKLRKKEEKLRTGFLQEAFSGIAGFDTLISDVRALRIDPASAISQGEALAKSLHDSYIAQANTLKDKRTRNTALKDVSRVDSQAQAKLAELRAAADKARSAGDRQRRLIPEFASGAYIDPKIYNGMIAGRFDGRDSLLARLSHGEMVLNPSQIRMAISRAGHDVFAGIVPNYKTANPVPQTSFATGGFVNGNASPVMIQPIVEVHISENELSEVVFKANASDAGKRQTFKIIRDGKKLGDVS